MAELRPSLEIYEWVGASGTVDFVANPCGVSIDENGDIYVLDAGNHRIAVFSATGQFLRAFGRAGEGPGEFSLGRSYYDADIAVDAKHVFVTDPRLRRLHIFTKDGELVSTSGLTVRMNSLTTYDGLVYLAITGFNADRSEQILVLDTNSQADERVFAGLADPMIPASESPVTRYNRSQIAAGSGGRLMQVYFWWPVIRFHLPGVVSESFHAGPWWVDERHIGELPKLEDALAVAKTGALPAAQSRYPFFDDVEYIPSSDTWVTLVNGNRVHFFGDDRKLDRHVKLLPLEGAEPAALGDIAVSHDGRWLCAADATTESLVACYDLEQDQSSQSNGTRRAR